MKILLVSSFLPYPLTSGGNVRLFNLLKRISRHNQITLVCEKRSYQTQEDERMVLQFCNRLITVPRRKQWSVGNILKTGFSSFPFLLVGHTNYRMREIIKDLLNNEKFDLVHIETSYVMQNLPDVGLPTLLVEHNIEYLVYKRFAKNAPVFLKPFLYLDVGKLRFWEQRFWKKATRVAVVSEIEREVVEDVIGRRVFVIPNGVDIKEFSFNRRDLEEKWGKGEKRVLFVGNFSWIENRDAARFLIEEIWRSFKEKIRIQGLNDNLVLWIVGSNMPRWLLNYSGQEDIIIDAQNTSPVQKLFAEAFLLIAPIRVGGGTSFKILEAMACGVPVITTSLAKESLRAGSKEVLSADTTGEFADALVRLLMDKSLYIDTALSARKFVEERYNWDKIADLLLRAYEQTKDGKDL